MGRAVRGLAWGGMRDRVESSARAGAVVARCAGVQGGQREDWLSGTGDAGRHARVQEGQREHWCGEAHGVRGGHRKGWRGSGKTRGTAGVAAQGLAWGGMQDHGESNVRAGAVVRGRRGARDHKEGRGRAGMAGRQRGASDCGGRAESYGQETAT